jgi:hypothetical protein
MFPHRAIAALRQSRGPKWARLVERVLGQAETHEDTLAFMLMMIRLNGCMACETDSYRAMRGCSACALQTLRRYKGTDEDILAEFDRALEDIRAFAANSLPLGIQQVDQRLEIM